jgi:tripartite-type tricarboxylate transporter receptor subunit TctC
MKKILTLLIAMMMSTIALAYDIKIIVPFPAGGSTDQVTRMLQQHLTSKGIKSILEYKPGAGGLIASNYAANSKEPIIFVNGSAVLTHTITNKDNVQYELGKNLKFVGLIGIEPIILVTNENSKILNFSDIEKMDYVTYGTSGAGTSSYLMSASIFENLEKVSIVHYKGGAQSVIDVLSNNVNLIVESESVLSQHIKDKKLRPLAVISPVRLTNFPNIPTLSELSPKVFSSNGVYRFQGVYANSLVDQNILKEIEKIISTGQLRKEYDQMGLIPTKLSNDEFIKSELEKSISNLRKLNF